MAKFKYTLFLLRDHNKRKHTFEVTVPDEFADSQSVIDEEAINTMPQWISDGDWEIEDSQYKRVEQ